MLLEVFARHCWYLVFVEVGFLGSATAWRPLGKDPTYCWTVRRWSITAMVSESNRIAKVDE